MQGVRPPDEGDEESLLGVGELSSGRAAQTRSHCPGMVTVGLVGMLASAAAIGVVTALSQPPARGPGPRAESAPAPLRGLTQFQDDRGRCLAPLSAEKGAHLVLEECQAGAPETFVLDRAMARLTVNPNLCATPSDFAADWGKALVLDTCEVGNAAQQIAGMCISGDAPKNGTRRWAFLRACSGTSLFCFMAVLPNSREEVLHDWAESTGTGIFACDHHMVYWGYEALQGDSDTLAGAGSLLVKKQRQLSATPNAFVKLWEGVFSDGLFRTADWTVKTEPDTVWMPSRLRARLTELAVDAHKPLHVESVGQTPAPLEILTRAAVSDLAHSYDDCSEEYSLEDDWLKACVKSLGIPVLPSPHIQNSNGRTDECRDSRYVAFHPFKEKKDWVKCADEMSWFAG